MKQKTKMKTYFVELVKADPLLRKDYEISEEELKRFLHIYHFRLNGTFGVLSRPTKLIQLLGFCRSNN